MYCRTDVRKWIVKKAEKQFIEGRKTFTREDYDTFALKNKLEGGKPMSRKQAIAIAKDIIKRSSKMFNGMLSGYIVNTTEYEPIKFKLVPSLKLVEHYYSKIPADQRSEPLQASSSTEEEYFQIADDQNVVRTKADPSTIRKVKAFLDRIGVNYKAVSEITVQGSPVELNAVSDIVKGLVEYVEGYEDVTLSEEAMHFAVEILEQTNPQLFNQLFNKIGNYKIYDGIFTTYKDVYKNKDGTPNIRKIKKEAIGVLLSEMYIYENEGTVEDPSNLVYTKNWFEKVVEWLKGLFKKAEDINPFKQALKDIQNDNFGTVDDILAPTDTTPQTYDLGKFFQLSPRQRKDKFNVDEFITQLLAVNGKLNLVEEKKPDGTIDSYYMYNGTRVPKRVTDVLKSKMKDYNPTEDDEVRRLTGTAGHADIKDIMYRHVDENGYRRPSPLPQQFPSSINPNNNESYDALEKYIIAKLDSYSNKPGTRFFSELKLYNGVDTAGTIDFMAIEPDGTIDILDWKFVEIIGDQKSLLKAKVESYQLQMGEYKNLLSETYGVPKGNYRLTGMVPIQTFYTWDRVKKQKKYSKIKIGNNNYKLESNPVLLPIVTGDYSSGSKKIDDLIGQLNSIAEKYIEANRKREDKAALKDKINNFFAVIRKLQMQNDITMLIKNTQDHINELFLEHKRLKNELENPNTDIKELGNRIVQNRDILTVYQEKMDTALEDLFKGDEETRKKVNSIAAEAKRLKERYNSLIDEISIKVGENVGINDATRPERELGVIDRTIRSFSRAQTKTAQIFFRLYQQAQQAAAFATDTKINELIKLENEVEQLAKSQGISVYELYNKYLIREHKYGDQTYLRLIQRTDTEILNKIFKALDATDKREARTLVNQYVNLDAYVEEYEKDKERFFTAIDKNTYSGDEAKDAQQKRQIKEKWLAENDISKNSALIRSNGRLFKHLKENSYSKEFNELRATPVMYKLYELQIQANERAVSKGLLPYNQKFTFIPNVKKQYTDRLVQGGDKSILTTIINNVKVDPGFDNTYGATDPITRKSVMTIPKAFVYDLPTTEKSRDLVKSLALWEREINEYTWKTELEGVTKILMDTENRKEMLKPNPEKRGALEVVPKPEEGDKNSEYLKNYINYYIYNKRMIDNSMDFKFEVNLKAISDKVNKKLGFNLLPEYEGENEKITVSFTKMVQSANRWFQMKTLGFNLTTPISNLTGGLANALIMSGKYFTPDEYKMNTLRLTSMLTGEQGKVYAAMIDYFMPLVENQEGVKMAGLTSNKISELMTSEVLFMLQRGSDKIVTYPMLLSILENTAVIDGQLVNIPEYVRKQKGYYGRFYLPKEERIRVEKEVEQEILKMKEQSVMKTAKIVDGELIIDGIKRSDKTVWELRNKVQSMAKDVMGASSPEDISQYRMSLFGQSFMMFKNWIPGMALTRFGDLDYNVGTDSWEYGRLRLMYKLIFDNGINSLKTLRDVINLNENGMEYMRKVYDQKLKEYVEEEGGSEEDFISEEEFLELHHRAIKMAVKETQYWLAMMSAFIGFTIATDDPEDDEYKGARAFFSRAFDKSKDELGFFFSPLSAMDIANGSVFPALGTVNDALKFMSHFGKEIGGAVFGVEDWSENAKPTKYLFKTFPITKEFLTIIAVFYPELADEMGIRISNNYSVR